jgi:hypothetical protein
VCGAPTPRDEREGGPRLVSENRSERILEPLHELDKTEHDEERERGRDEGNRKREKDSIRLRGRWCCVRHYAPRFQYAIQRGRSDRNE